MFKLRSGGLPVSVVVIAARLCVCALMLMLGACASRQAQYRGGPQFRLASQQTRVAGYRKVAPPIDLEDDGIEAQTPPPARRLKNEPDDPSEPFSPNYGTAQVPDDSSDDEEDVVGVGTDSYDPFLDGPQWKNYGTERHEKGDVVGSYDYRPARAHPLSRVVVSSSRVRVDPSRLRPGFRDKRRGYTDGYGSSNSYF